MQRIRAWALVHAMILTAACGSGSSGTDSGVIDAGVPDAVPCSADQTRCDGLCVDTSTDPQHCGSCGNSCTPAQTCAAPMCECPTPVIDQGQRILHQMDAEMLAPVILGIGAYSDDSAIHAVVIGFEDPDTPVDQDIDLSQVSGAAPFVGLGYDINVNTRAYTAVYRAIAGTLHLTSRCSGGVMGTVTGAELVEVDEDSQQPLDGGCTTSIAELSFDYGVDCP